MSSSAWHTVVRAVAGTLTEGPYLYDSFGNGAPYTGVPFKYTGRRLDPETGLYYYRARYYTSALGRFLQTDAIGYADDIDWYTYAGNDPADKVDPSGNSDCDVTNHSISYCVIFASSDSSSPQSNDQNGSNGQNGSSGTNAQNGTNGTSGTQIAANNDNSTLNKDEFVTYMDKHASGRSKGQCALFCRHGLEAGGLDTTGHPGSAKDYGQFLENHGASKVPQAGYTPQKGDIAVFNGTAAHPNGHIEVYDGNRWISDFKQNHFSPYTKGPTPPHTIYRFP